MRGKPPQVRTEGLDATVAPSPATLSRASNADADGVRVTTPPPRGDTSVNVQSGHCTAFHNQESYR